MVKILYVKGNELTLRKSINEPNFLGKTVLVNDPWEFVEMWLRRNKNSDDAIFYWQQARQFYEAAMMLPLTSSPLTIYYCFLNATKALLKVKNVNFTDRHGVTGHKKLTRISLSNEIVEFKTSGILPSLCNYLDEPIHSPQKFTLKELLYNLVYIHRAYCLTYTSESSKELFIPLNKTFFVKKDNSKESWFAAEIDAKYANGHVLKKIEKNFEVDINFQNDFVIRYKKRFEWKGNDTISFPKFISYHKKIRKQVQYIAGASGRWYIKRDGTSGIVPFSSLAITFASMHRLSELSRYDPITLSRHLNSQHNWLLSEFIKNSPFQFIDEIASEITGEQFLLPRRFSGNLTV